MNAEDIHLLKGFLGLEREKLQLLETIGARQNKITFSKCAL